MKSHPPPGRRHRRLCAARAARGRSISGTIFVTGQVHVQLTGINPPTAQGGRMAISNKHFAPTGQAGKSRSALQTFCPYGARGRDACTTKQFAPAGGSGCALRARLKRGRPGRREVVRTLKGFAISPKARTPVPQLPCASGAADQCGEERCLQGEPEAGDQNP